MGADGRTFLPELHVFHPLVGGIAEFPYELLFLEAGDRAEGGGLGEMEPQCQLLEGKLVLGSGPELASY